MIRENVRQIRERIAAACRNVGRDPTEVTLVAVSKTWSADKIREVVAAGVCDVGENYVQELLAKRELLKDEKIRWHFIGHLQSNKVKYVAAWTHLFHAVDSVGLARELDNRAAKAGTTIDCLVEVNTTGESSKFGLSLANTVDFVRGLAPLSHICIRGLMTIGPFLPDPERSRPMFRQLKTLKAESERLGQQNVCMTHLSMGMTNDFEVAIEEGATLVRIGTAIFGQRKSMQGGH